MIGAHPGGLELTGRLLKLADAHPPAKVLDLGAGTGESLCYLKDLGYDAVGIDRKPQSAGEDMAQGDMTALAFPDESFAYVLAECSISVCGDGPAALREAGRVLRPGGSLLLSDVFFQKEMAPCLSMQGPLTFSCWEREILGAGLCLRAYTDETALWRAFFLESLWNDNADEAFCDFFREAGKAGCGYFLAWLQKPAVSRETLIGV